jgi:hypothetical protein
MHCNTATGVVVLDLIGTVFKPRSALALENLALRQQLAVLQRIGASSMHCDLPDLDSEPIRECEVK